MATRISKFSSLQSGPFNVSNNILDIDVQGSFADLTQSYVSLKVDIQTKEGAGPTVQGVHKVNLLYDAASFVRHCHVSFERLGIVEETQFNNIFNYNYDKMKKTYQMQRNDTTNGRTYAYFDDGQYFLAPDVSNANEQAGIGSPVYSPFRLIYQNGATASASLQPELRIMCSQLFGIGAIDMLPMLALGKMRIHLELENVLTLVQETPQIIGGYECQPITGLNAANTTIQTWNWYGFTAASPQWADTDVLTIQYQLSPDIGQPFRTYVMTNTVGSTVINADTSATITLGARIPAIGGANATTRNVIMWTTPAASAGLTPTACNDVGNGVAAADRNAIVSTGNIAIGASPFKVGDSATVNYTVGGVAYSQAVTIAAVAVSGGTKLQFTFRNVLAERIIAGDASAITLTDNTLADNQALDRVPCLPLAAAGKTLKIVGTIPSAEQMPIWVGELISVFYVDAAGDEQNNLYTITAIAWTATNNDIQVTVAPASAAAAALPGGNVPISTQIYIAKVRLPPTATALSWQVTKAQFVLYETMLPAATAKQVMASKNVLPFMSKRVEQFYMPAATGQWSKLFDLEPNTVAAFILSAVGRKDNAFLDQLVSNQDTEAGFRFSIQGPGVTTDLTDQDILPWSGLYNDRLVAAMQATGVPCRNLAEYIFTMATAIPQLSQQQQLQLRQVLSAVSTAKNMYLFKIIRRALMIDGGKVSMQ